MKKSLTRSVFAIFSVIMFFGCASYEKKMRTMFYPSLPQQPRLQFLFSITDEEDIGKKSIAFQEFLLGKISSIKNIARSYDIGAVKGKIYISDRYYKKILIIDLVKKELDYLRDEGEGTLGEPCGIWVTEDDIKYVADFQRKQIVVYDKDNKFFRAYGGKDIFERPIDVAVYKNRIYVCDELKHHIIVLDKDTGKVIQTLGKIGIKDGYFHRPTHVRVDHEGNIYVNDALNFRIQKFDPEGNPQKTFGYHGNTLGALARPKGLDIDEEGHIYVADATFGNVQIFADSSTGLLLFFGGYGLQPGSMYLPSGVYIDYYNVEYFKKYADKDFNLKYLIYVGNMLGDKKLNVYGFGDWKGESLPKTKR